jgi:hypothetical protein
VKSAAREALKSYSEFYYLKEKGYAVHHWPVPFESILEVYMDDYPDGIPVAYTNMRYELEQWVAMDFARVHDEIIKSKGACWYVTTAEHIEIHRELKRDCKERELIDEWVERLRNDKTQAKQIIR